MLYEAILLTWQLYGCFDREGKKTIKKKEVNDESNFSVFFFFLELVECTIIEIIYRVGMGCTPLFILFEYYF